MECTCLSSRRAVAEALWRMTVFLFPDTGVAVTCWHPRYASEATSLEIVSVAHRTCHPVLSIHSSGESLCPPFICDDIWPRYSRVSSRISASAAWRSARCGPCRGRAASMSASVHLQVPLNIRERFDPFE